MTVMDSQSRIIVTENIREVTNLDFKKEIRLFLKEKDEKRYLILSNNPNLSLPCFGIVRFDAKFRFFIPKELRKYLELEPSSKLLVYAVRGNLIIKKI